MASSSLSAENDDRLSNLPEDIVNQIISLLSTKEAIATSTLSRRWRFHWTSITNLDFDDSTGDGEGSITDFSKYVSKVLLMVNTPVIHNFTLKLTHFDDKFHVDRWICDAVARNVKEVELSLHVFDWDPIPLPTCLIYHQTLEVLKLCTTWGIELTIPKSKTVCFPCLKILFLELVIFRGVLAEDKSICFPVLEELHLFEIETSDTSLSHLIRVCPVLEHLFITRFQYSEKLNIFAPALTHLEFDDSMEVDSKIEIDAPMLKYLAVSGWHMSQKVTVKEPNSIIEAKLDEMWHSDHQDDLQVDHLMKVIKNVQRLAILGYSLDYMNVVIPVVPLFCKLTRLEVDVSCCGLTILQRFLEKSANLEDLVIKVVGRSLRDHKKDEHIWWQDQAPVPECFITSLKFVKILGALDCNTFKFAFIEYILKNAKILEIMNIVTSGVDFDTADQIMQKISIVPIGSTCEVSFS